MILLGLMEKLFGKKEQPAAVKAQHTFQLLDGYTPAFHNWHGSIFESDLIRAALDAHGRHAAKLQFNIEGSAKPNLANRLKVQPNPYNTWSQFQYRTAVILYARNTAFLVPTRGEYGEANGVTVILPDRWELVEYNGTPYIRFWLPNNKRMACSLYEAGILTRYQYRSDLFGESNDAMKATLDLIEIQRQGIQEGIKNGASYRFSAQSDNWSSDEDLASEMERFNKFTFQNKKTSGGLVLFPNTYTNVQQVKQEAYKVDPDQQKLIKDNVFDYFAVNEDVIQNKTFGDAWLAFYEGAVEWFAIQLSEVLTRMIFTQQEQTRGNAVFFSANRLQYMSVTDKVSMWQQMGDRGAMMIDEGRELFDMAPLPDGAGQHAPIRGEYYFVDKGRPDDKPEDQKKDGGEEE